MLEIVACFVGIVVAFVLGIGWGRRAYARQIKDVFKHNRTLSGIGDKPVIIADKGKYDELIKIRDNFHNKEEKVDTVRISEVKERIKGEQHADSKSSGKR